MSDLVTFLRDRLDEDEAAARAALADGDDYHGLGCESTQAWGEHDDRHDPARVLADVATKRAIVGLHVALWCADEYCTVCDSEAWPCPTLRHLAAVWAGHSDYDERWKP